MSTAMHRVLGSGPVRRARVRLRPVRARLAPLERRVRRARLPLLSVVVPVHDAATTLERCVDSVLQQAWLRVEVVLVADGADPASLRVARDLAARHREVRLVEQDQQGVGAARNRGVDQARGTLLAFLDADDTVPEQGYLRLVRALRSSGSDQAVGGLTLEEGGRSQRPPWMEESNGTRRLATTVAAHPDLLAHLYLGPRVFLRRAWDAAGLRFSTTTQFPDLDLVVRSTTGAASLDVVAAACYHQLSRPDGRSLAQRSLRDPALGADRVVQARLALSLLSEAPEEQRLAAARGVVRLLTDVVRYAVVYGEPSWSTVSAEVRALADTLDDDAWVHLPLFERILTLLSAEGGLDAAERFLEHSFMNRAGYPYTLEHGRPVVHLDMLDGLQTDDDHLTAIADGELRLRTRLNAAVWTAPTRLRVVGTAFVDYLTAASPEATTRLVLVERGSGEETVVETRHAPDVEVNRWAGRGYEDLTDAAFEAELDLVELGLQRDVPATYDVLVEHEAAGRVRRGSFQVRHLEGAAGLLEQGGVPGTAWTPVWRPFRGLSLVRRPGADPAPPPAPSRPEVVSFALDGDHLVAVLSLAGRGPGRARRGAEEDLRLSLRGPRTGTPWVEGRPTGTPGTLEFRLPLLVDEWGTGPAHLPSDRYHVRLRREGRPDEPVGLERRLHLALPSIMSDDEQSISPEVELDGALRLRIAPPQWERDQPPYGRLQLRDVVYPAARELPLLDLVVFDTFAGKSSGDQPGALCAEIASRGLDLDLVVAVVDHSVTVPAGSRAVVRMSREHVELLARARYVVVNAGLPYFFRKRPDQAVLQTWHGSPLKRIGHDRILNDVSNWNHRRELLTARDQWDFLVSQSPFCTEKLRSAFRYSGTILEEGYPRNDVLSSPERDRIRSEVRAALGIAEDARVVLYAPTWRDNLRSGAVYHKVIYLEPDEVAQTLDCTVLVRGHYNSIKAAEERHPDPRVIDVTRYPDIALLYVAADTMVTDYSSAFFDFAAIDRPMVFLAPDLAAYRDDNRGFYVDYHETVPGPVCLTNDEVVEELRTVFADPTTGAERRAAFRRDFAPYDDGHVSRRVVDALFERFPPPPAAGPAV
ncbi:Glycosyl transferase family 2 [Nocardioides scoriae]|uniref:Glycosyl transferase family 2 n=1 Tax=Nocardioides scoriae TaxID=642780 RepID=A0A1H1TYJ9_9ACTN|nr:CDP-glycerol glycerophosphotransferase family protein [Nocardioides scoriae]SDS65303.1 Glycosyl transferase family 2 [Nocardioides scoriae]